MDARGCRSARVQVRPRIGAGCRQHDCGETANALAAIVDEVDTALMPVSWLMVMLTIGPGLALFCGGLVRA